MVHVQSLLTLLSLSPIRMRNSWRECQGLAWSGPPRERRSSNTATTSSSGRGKKTHTHTRFPPLSLFPLALFFHVPSLLLPVSSLISPIFSLLSSFIFASPCSSSSFLPSFLLFFPLSLFFHVPHLLLLYIIDTVLGFRALSQCPWTSKTFVCSMRSHTGSAGRLTAQGRSVSVSFTV